MLAADLKINSGKHAGKVLSLTVKKFLIGRGEDCHMRPNTDLVSRHHCVFNLDDYSVRLRDLGSTNGTFVNDEQIKGQVELKTGDLVRVGKLEFIVTVKEGAQAAPAEPDEATELSGETIPVMEEAPEEVEEMAETDTMYEVPAMQDEMQDTAMMNEGDTQFASPQQPEAMPPGLQYAPGSLPPGYAYPPQGYPQMPPGYPPQQMPPGQFGYQYPPMPGYPQQYPPQQYPPQQYPGQPYLGQQYPGQQYPPQQYPEQEQVQEEEPKKKGQDVRLPDPSETGAKEEPKKEEGERESKGTSFAKENPSSKAGDIIQQYMKRRPNT